MKSENELDDFLRAKEQEFQVPYEDKYWEQTAAFLDAERGGRTVTIFWSVRNIIMICAALLIVGTGAYFVLNQKSNIKNHGPIDNGQLTQDSRPKTQDQISEATEGKNNTSNVQTQDARAKTQDQISDNQNNTITNNTTSTLSNSKSVDNGTIAAAKTLDSKTAHAAKTKGINSTHASSNNTGSKVTSVTTGTKSDKGVLTQDQDAHGDVLLITGMPENMPTVIINSSSSVTYVDEHIQSLSPLFRDLTLSAAQRKQYNLALKSDGSGAYTKVREFKSGTQYPIISVSATAGVNLFNNFRDNSKSYSYVSTNPFLGVKASYQWNNKWFAQAQLNAVVRGGVNQVRPNSNETFAATYTSLGVRHLYYLQLPVSLGYQFSQRNAVTAGLGISYLLSDGAENRIDSTGKFNGGYRLESPKGFNKLDAFVILGYNFKLDKKISFTVNASYGFMDVTDNTYFAEDKRHNNMSLGFAINYLLYSKKAVAR